MCKINISVLSFFINSFCPVLPDPVGLLADKYVASTALGSEPELLDGNVKTPTMPHSAAAARDEEELRVSFMPSVPCSTVTASGAILSCSTQHNS